jgi:hypothetical protein
MLAYAVDGLYDNTIRSPYLGNNTTEASTIFAVGFEFWKLGGVDFF